jgi:integrase
MLGSDALGQLAEDLRMSMEEVAEHSPTHTAARALRRAGIEDATLHDLRLTAGSLAVSRGVPLLVVSRFLGHSSPLVTARVGGGQAAGR